MSVSDERAVPHADKYDGFRGLAEDAGIRTDRCPADENPGMSSDAFESALAESFEQAFDTDAAVAEEVAAQATAFREEHDVDVDPEAFLEEMKAAPYEDFDHRFDCAIGELAAAAEDCTDSRAYRRSGFDEMAADPSIGT